MNGERYKKDLDALIAKGGQLQNAIQYECYPDEFTSTAEASLGDQTKGFIDSLPSFKEEYQPWYSEAKALVRQLLPDRLSDFTRYYEKPKSRRDITHENYTIEDYLQGLNITVGAGVTLSKIVGPDAAIPSFNQQISIVKSIQESFRSSLFKVRQLAQADLFDSELDAARELAKTQFHRAAGAVAGVVLEKHLKEVCDNHSIKVRKNAKISNMNDDLKDANVVDTHEWRFIQHLADLRHLCAHDRKKEPTADQIEDLLAGVAKVTMTIF
ncbi:MAG: hypothetical protein OXE05_06015 [Chloroflexi bacterium]|nr:hypothetical protein [Chloroflexota bacterium]